MDTAITWTETPAGRQAWRVTGYRQIKTLMEDRRLSMEHPDPEVTLQWYSDSPMHRILVRLAAHPLPDRKADQAERALRRGSMTRIFSTQNIHRTTPDISAFANELLDELAASTPPVDLTESFSVPLCARVICDLLNVPAGDVGKFRRWADDKDHADLRRSMIGLKELMSYVHALVEQRKEQPGDDIVSTLLAAQARGDDFQEGRITNLVAWMLGLGWQVAASAIDYGALLLMAHPDQLQVLQAEPALRSSAVEEVLRLFNATSAAIGGLDRYAHDEIEIDGIKIRTGDMVLLDVPAANRDASIFPNPDDFDIRRSPNPHLTFGHGFYFCNFNRVARNEVEIGLAALFERFPGLRLSGDAHELEFKDHPQSGLVRLPVTW